MFPDLCDVNLLKSSLEEINILLSSPSLEYFGICMATVMSVWRRLVNRENKLPSLCIYKKLVCFHMPFFRRKSHSQTGEISSRFGRLVIRRPGAREKKIVFTLY